MIAVAVAFAYSYTCSALDARGFQRRESSMAKRCEGTMYSCRVLSSGSSISVGHLIVIIPCKSCVLIAEQPTRDWHSLFDSDVQLLLCHWFRPRVYASASFHVSLAHLSMIRQIQTCCEC